MHIFRAKLLWIGGAVLSLGLLGGCADMSRDEQLGAVTGAVVGGLAGSAIGGGAGNSVAIGAGAAIGAIAGEHIARHNSGYYTPVWRCRMSHGRLVYVHNYHAARSIESNGDGWCNRVR